MERSHGAFSTSHQPPTGLCVSAHCMFSCTTCCLSESINWARWSLAFSSRTLTSSPTMVTAARRTWRILQNPSFGIGLLCCSPIPGLGSGALKRLNDALLYSPRFHSSCTASVAATAPAHVPTQMRKEDEPGAGSLRAHTLKKAVTSHFLANSPAQTKPHLVNSLQGALRLCLAPLDSQPIHAALSSSVGKHFIRWPPSLTARKLCAPELEGRFPRPVELTANPSG